MARRRLGTRRYSPHRTSTRWHRRWRRNSPHRAGTRAGHALQHHSLLMPSRCDTGGAHDEGGPGPSTSVPGLRRLPAASHPQWGAYPDWAHSTATVTYWRRSRRRSGRARPCEIRRPNATRCTRWRRRQAPTRRIRRRVAERARVHLRICVFVGWRRARRVQRSGNRKVWRHEGPRWRLRLPLLRRPLRNGGRASARSRGARPRGWCCTRTT